MAFWKQTQQQPFTTYRDPKTGRWMVVKSSQPVESTLVEAPVYRDSKTGRWMVGKPSPPIEGMLVEDSL